MSNNLFSGWRQIVCQLQRCTFAVVILTIILTVFNGAAQAQLNLDPTFNGGVTDGDTNVYVTRPLTDGKILVGGNFRIVNGVEKTGLVRLNADGTLDNTFNAGGGGPNNGVYEVIALSDGKFLIGGLFTQYSNVAKSGIVRINADGSLDPTFNPGGTGTTGTVQTISLQSDGKILIAGSGLSAYNGTARFSVMRLNADGTLDTTFNSPFTSTQFVEEVRAQSDGKIVIGGAFFIGNRSDVARLNADGSIDTSFNPGGGTDGNGVYALAVQADGRILIGGAFQSYNNTPRSGIARLNIDGTLDASFDPGISIGINGGEYFVIQPDGKILVAGGFGSASNNYSIIRLNANGSLDPTFTLNQTNGTGYHISLQPDGKVLLSGFFTVFNNQTRRNLVRLNSNGTLDASLTATFSAFPLVNAVAQQPDGKIVVGGTFNFANGAVRQNLARLNADGSTDTSFNSGTGTFPDPSSSANVISDLALQPDGKIVIVGTFGGYDGTMRRTIARINTDGSLDNSFDATGFIGILITSFAFEVFVQPDGKILVGGLFQDAINGSAQYLIRLNPNGSLDTSFTGNPNNTVRAIVRQPDGKLIIGGTFTTFSGQSRVRIVRLNTDGTVDSTFDPGAGFSGTVVDLAIQPDGRIIAVGTFTTFNGTPRTRVARLNADGTLDPTFNSGSGANNTVSSVTLSANGKIVIGGTFSIYNGTSANRLARLNSDGTLDPTFTSGFDNDPGFFVRRVLTQTDGKILVGGQFKAYGNNSRSSILRLSPIAARRTQFDFDGDGRADQAVFRPSDQVWYLLRSSSGFTAAQFGFSTDRITPADFDGDGRTDLAVFRDGVWYWINSSNGSFNAVQFGQSGDVPVPADYTGDNRAELAVFRAGIWYTLNLVNNQFSAVQFGISNDKPVPADFDADGKNDLAVYRDGIWYWLQSSDNAFRSVQFGVASDRPTVGDYDGDGRADQAVFRPSDRVWYVFGSSQGFRAVQFGIVGAVPTPSDYDGDGKIDFGVYRADNGTWYWLRSLDGGFRSVQFGIAEDKPIPASFVP